jgi:hypothetical protein
MKCLVTLNLFQGLNGREMLKQVQHDIKQEICIDKNHKELWGRISYQNLLI